MSEIHTDEWKHRRDTLVGFVIMCNNNNCSNRPFDDARSVRPVITCENVLEAMRERMPDITAAQRVDFVHVAKGFIPIK